MKIKTLLFSTLVCASLVGCGNEAQQTASSPKQVAKSTTELCYGMYNSDKLISQIKKFTPVKKYLQDKLKSAGIPVKIDSKIYPTYEEAIDALVKGDCDFFRLGPASYVLAKNQNQNIRILAMEHKNNKKISLGVFIVSKDSPIENLSEIKGKSFAFGNENSTIGRYLSQAELVNAGIHSSDLKSHEFLHRHDKVAEAVIAGKFDVGVIKESTFKKNADSLKEIATFPNVTKPWVAREGLDEALFDALQTAFLTLDDEEVLKTIKKSGFLAASDQDYDFVRQNMELSMQFDDAVNSDVRIAKTHSEVNAE